MLWDINVSTRDIAVYSEVGSSSRTEWPAWSPRGTKIVFNSHAVVEIRRRLFKEPGSTGHPASREKEPGRVPPDSCSPPRSETIGTWCSEARVSPAVLERFLRLQRRTPRKVQSLRFLGPKTCNPGACRLPPRVPTATAARRHAEVLRMICTHDLLLRGPYLTRNLSNCVALVWIGAMFSGENAVWSISSRSAAHSDAAVLTAGRIAHLRRPSGVAGRPPGAPSRGSRGGDQNRVHAPSTPDRR